MKTIEKRREQLDARLEELSQRLVEIESLLDQPSNRDDEERATEREADEVLEGMGNAGLQEIRIIEAALSRIDEGEYGYCVKCGEQISDERLDVVPHAPLCHRCAV